MTKIINGRKYSTDTATLLAYWENMDYAFDYNWVSESLYRKRTGEFFLFCRGGAGTRYADCWDDKTRSEGTYFRPLDYQEAFNWASEKLSGEKVEEISGPIPE